MVNMLEILLPWSTQISHQHVGGLQYVFGLSIQGITVEVLPETIIIKYISRRIEICYQNKMFTRSDSQFRFQIALKRGVLY